MKRIIFIALAISGLSLAGSLRSGTDFTQAMIQALNTKETTCQSDLYKSREIGFVCAEYPKSLDFEDSKTVWEREAPLSAFKLNLKYSKAASWGSENIGETSLLYELNGDQHAIQFIRGSNEDGIIVFSSMSGYGSVPVAATSPLREFRGTAKVNFDPNGPDLDCADFSSQSAAQTFFLGIGGVDFDPHQLDADNDGDACEKNEPWTLTGTGFAKTVNRPEKVQVRSIPLIVLTVPAPNPVALPVTNPASPAVTPPPAPAGPKMCWVNGYRKANGTYVNGYWRRC